MPDENAPLLDGKMSHQPHGTLERPPNGSKTLAIGHRGFKARFPENTMASFAGAVKAGAHAIETDVHLSHDGVVMLSHDPTLKRCFGVDGKIIDYDYNYLKTLRTLAAPHVPMPTFKELLVYLCEPGNLHIWVLLDIKTDNDADDVMNCIAETVKSVPGGRWEERVMLGCWTLKFLPLCEQYLPGFRIVHIGFNISYAREFLKYPNVNFNMFYALLLGPTGRRFLRDAKNADRKIFAWTINEEDFMKWAIREPDVDGICTDDPEKFLALCDSYTVTWTREKSSASRSVKIFFLHCLVSILSTIMFYWRFGGRYDMPKTGRTFSKYRL